MRAHLDPRLGDLNVTPFSVSSPSSTGKGTCAGLTATWPAKPPWLALAMGIPIDHALAGPDLSVTSFELGDPAGSDHRPVVVGLRAEAV